MNNNGASIQIALHQQLSGFLQKHYKHFNIYYQIIISTLLASFTANIFNKSELMYGQISNMWIFLKKFLLYRKQHTISLISKKIWTKYGRYKNIISEEKLGVLYYISKRLHTLKDLSKLTQDYRMTKQDTMYCNEKAVLDTYYSISPDNIVEIFRDKNTYITAEITECIDNNDTNTSTMQKMITDELILSSNLSLTKLTEFINDAKQERLEKIDIDPNRYIYTYLGEDEDKNPIFEQETFMPYCEFNKLVGETPKTIERSFDFFCSQKGKNWYKKRNLPYQLTVLLYGQPGTGKSCIASAVAKKYNLHIVKIKLSLIKTNFQFIKAFKNKTFNEKKIDFDNILYLFDELDTETNAILKNRNKYPTHTQNSDHGGEDDDDDKEKEKQKSLLQKYNIKDNDLDDLLRSMRVPKNDTSDALTLGTILEELNGINQMYGRKMFIISNHPDKLDKAILRPGRIDLQFELTTCTPCEVMELIRMFFEDIVFEQHEVEQIKQLNITAAKLANVCKISKDKDHLMKLLE